MGFDTTIIINNDMLSEIESDANFGRMVAQAIRALPGSDGPVPIGNGAYAIESHHMDGITVVAVGGRKGQILGGCPFTTNVLSILKDIAGRHNCVVLTEEAFQGLNKKPDMSELREWADAKGYRLVRMTKDTADNEELTRDEERAVDRALAGRTIPLDEEHIGELSEELLREKPKRMTIQEMNDYVKKIYGCRMIKLVRKGEKQAKNRKTG